MRKKTIKTKLNWGSAPEPGIFRFEANGMKSCCRENDYAVGKKAINPAVLWTDPINMIEKYLCNHATVSKKFDYVDLDFPV